MRRFLFLFIIFLAVINNSDCQFLSMSSGVRNNSLSLGFYDYYFRFNDSEKNYFEDELLKFIKLIPELTYENENLLISLAYSKSTYDGHRTSLFGVDGYYKLMVPLTSPDVLFVSIPVLLKTSYLKITQQKNQKDIRFESGNVGIGTGLQLSKSFEWIKMRLLYDFCANYSTLNFSVDYGYSLQNEFILSFDLNQLFDNIGITFGGKYSDQKWKLSNKKYNYYNSNLGVFVGVVF